VTATWRVGYGGAAGAKAMGEYLTMEPLTPEQGTAAAYYLGEVPAREWSFVDHLGQQIAAGEISYGDALDMLVRAEVRANNPDDIISFEERIGDQLSDAAMRAEIEFGTGKPQDRVGAIARVRDDLPPEVAKKLGIDRSEPLSLEALTNLLSGRRADGAEIEGKTQRSASRSVAEVFGLQALGEPPDEAAIRNILAGRRADGAKPSIKGEELSDEVIAGARKRFLDIFEAPKNRALTDGEIANMAAGKMPVRGIPLTMYQWQTKVNARHERVTFLDLTLSADKSVSVSWALAPTDAERAIVQNAHRDAVVRAMEYLESHLALARRGDGGRHGTEPGKVAWFSFDHYTSRPTVDYACIDKEGQAYTKFSDVPHRTPDMQLHTHSIVPNSVFTESGHVGSMDLDRLNGITKTLGAIYHAHLAQNLREHGIEVARDERTGAARIMSIPERVSRHFSKRTQEAETAARDYAKARGLDWDRLSGEQKAALLKAGGNQLRQAKDNDHELPSDFARWRDEATGIGYQHRSVLRLDAIKPALVPEQRIEIAYQTAAKDLSEAFKTKATLDLDEAKEVAARSLIVAGIEDAAMDIAAVMKQVQTRGIEMDGERTPVVFARTEAVRGKVSWSLTTGLAERQEREVVAHVRELAKDRSAVLAPEAIERASARFLASRRESGRPIDPNHPQWQAQRAMMHGLAANGRVSLGIGVAGSGKTTVLTPLVDAWKRDGRQVYGAALAWRQAEGLRESGIVQLKEAGIEATAALDPFISRVEKSRITPDSQSVVVVDEVGLVGTRQLHKLSELQQKHGFQLVMLGDPEQCAAIEAGPVIKLMQDGLGKRAVPEIVTSIRQKTERELETTRLWREGRAGEALERKREDGELNLVAGPRLAVIEAAAAHWQQRHAALDPGKMLLVIAPTNNDAHELGIAIRERKRDACELGPDLVSVKVRDPNARVDREMTLAAGDQVRLFKRVQGGKTVLGNNGDVVEVLYADTAGLRARNVATKVEASVSWQQLAPRFADLPALSYGYATTVYTAQSQTVAEAMFVLPGGSRQVDRGQAYTALSRHEHLVSLIISEGAERRQITRHLAPGTFKDIGLHDVLNNIADNLSRRTEKASAMELIRDSAIVRRGSIQQAARATEPLERMKQAGRMVIREVDRVRAEVSQTVQRMTQSLRAERAQQQQHREGPSLGR